MNDKEPKRFNRFGSQDSDVTLNDDCTVDDHTVRPDGSPDGTSHGHEHRGEDQDESGQPDAELAATTDDRLHGFLTGEAFEEIVFQAAVSGDPGGTDFGNVGHTDFTSKVTVGARQEGGHHGGDAPGGA